MPQYAVIKTGGKQYLVEPGKKYKFEKLAGEVGGPAVFNDVLLIFTDGGADLKIGTPTIDGAQVSGVIIRQARAPKITVVKYKAKSRYRRKLGHRQYFTEIEIKEIKN